MKKELFIRICNRLRTEVPELRWIDVEEGQLNYEERPPVAFPACLVDMGYSNCETKSGQVQQVLVSVTLRVIFQGSGNTSANTPEPVRLKALERLDVLDKIHHALQYWKPDSESMRMTRKRALPEKRPDGLKVYNVAYTFVYLDS